MMPEQLEQLYQKAKTALKVKNYDRASGLLKQILVIDENYKDASRLLAQAVKLKRRRWYSDPRLWGALAGVVIIGLIVWLIPRLSLDKMFVPPELTTNPMVAVTPTITKVPTKTPTFTPTLIPLAWKRIFIGQEFPRDTITAIVIDPKDPDLIYVGTQNAGIYKSIDGGLSWQPAHQGLGGAWVSSLIIDSQNPQTLYAGIALAGVYKTTDGGNNWGPINDGIDTNGWESVSTVAVSPDDSKQLYYTQARSFYTSTNGGESWTEILSGGGQSSVCPRQIVSLAIDPGNPDSLLAFNLENPGVNMICQEGVYRSSDGGRSWVLALQLDPIYGLHPAILAYDETWENLYATNKNTVYRSNDHGETWLQLPPEDCVVFVADPQDGSIAYCASNSKIIVTRDGGASWHDTLKGDEYAGAIAVSPHSGQTVLVGWNGLWITTDDGKSWSTANNGVGAIHMDLSFDPMDPSALLVEDPEAVISCIVYRSTDGGRQWDPAPDRTCQSKMALNSSGEWLYWIDKDDGSLRRSNDGGLTSQKLILRIESQWPQIIVSDPTEADRLIAVFDLEPYFFISDDNGESWHGASLIEWDQYKHPGPNPRIFFAHDQGGQIYLIALSYLYRSDDAGESWQGCSNPESWLGTVSRKAGMIIWPEDADHILLATRGNGVLISKNGCQSWQASNTGLGSLFVNALAMDPNSPNTIYAGTDGGAYISFDGGQTWHQINDGLLGATVVYSIVVDKDSNVYATTPYGIFKLESK